MTLLIKPFIFDILLYSFTHRLTRVLCIAGLVLAVLLSLLAIYEVFKLTDKEINAGEANFEIRSYKRSVWAAVILGAILFYNPWDYNMDYVEQANRYYIYLVPAILVSGLLFFVPKSGYAKRQKISLLLTTGAISFGFTPVVFDNLNDLLNQDKFEIQKHTLLSKEKADAGIPLLGLKHYYLVLTPYWFDLSKSVICKTDKKVYALYAPGDSIKTAYHQGYLGTKWISVMYKE
ncbi:MAG: hypothetical protein V4543_11725 [Bacteroidota bacterium]